MTYRNWHQKAALQMTKGDRIADAVAAFVGSWKFVIIQTVIMTLWVVFNTIIATRWLSGHGFDPFPFVFLNLFMSAEAAYSTPFIMMSQNRAAARDKVQAEHQYTHQEKELQLQTQILLDQNKVLKELRKK